jgi:hypothetical protein
MRSKIFSPAKWVPLTSNIVAPSKEGRLHADRNLQEAAFALKRIVNP